MSLEAVPTNFASRTSLLPLELQTVVVLVVIVILFHTMDRQIEFTSRTDYLWKAKLKVEQEEVETMRGINKVVSLKALQQRLRSLFSDSFRKHSPRSRCRALPCLAGYARTLPRAISLHCCNVRFDPQLQRVLRRKRCE